LSVVAARRLVVAVAGRAPLAAGTIARVVRAVVAGESSRGRPRAGPVPRVTVVQVTFLTQPAMRRLNREWKGHDRPTDVLSFALPGPGGELVGDVYICPAVARRQAREFLATPREELLRLVIHGTLHLLGHDHPEGAGRTHGAMWRRQEGYLSRLA
jgi:probable rRNA maturation factor